MTLTEMRKNLGTKVLRLDYDFSNRAGTLYLPELCCTDMMGCIKLFKAVDPEVEKIATIAGDEPDVVYVKRLQGWRAVDMRTTYPRNLPPSMQ